jgi:hypothetical protein
MLNLRITPHWLSGSVAILLMSGAAIAYFASDRTVPTNRDSEPLNSRTVEATPDESANGEAEPSAALAKQSKDTIQAILRARDLREMGKEQARNTKPNTGSSILLHITE